MHKSARLPLGASNNLSDLLIVIPVAQETWYVKIAVPVARNIAARRFLGFLRLARRRYDGLMIW